MTTLNLSYSFASKKVKSLNFLKINWKIYCFIAFSIALSLAVFYVLEVNYMIRGSYLIKDYQKQLESISQTSKILESNFAKTGFVGIVGEKAQELSFEKVEKVKYIEILDASFASVNHSNIR